MAKRGMMEEEALESEKTNGKKAAKESHVTVQISPPNLQTAAFRIVGTTPYVQNKFSAKAKQIMHQTQEAGSTAKKGKVRERKDFQECYREAQYRPLDGDWGAIPATAFKAAMVAACRLVDFKMTDCKQALYVETDGYDHTEMVPLVRITKGTPKYFEQAVRNANGSADLRARPMWDPGWEAVVRITYDADRFTLADVTNLLMRAGLQVGVGEGRQASRMSVGVGWGAFKIAGAE